MEEWATDDWTSLTDLLDQVEDLEQDLASSLRDQGISMMKAVVAQAGFRDDGEKLLHISNSLYDSMKFSWYIVI